MRRSLRNFSGTGYSKGRNIAWQALWYATQHLLFRAWWLPARVRPSLLRLFGGVVGERVLIRRGVRIHWPWKFVCGDDVWIGEDAWLLNLEPITLGNDVCVSQDAFLCTGSHDVRSNSFEFDNGPIVIESSAWIAARAMVLRGVTVGAGAVLGANAVVASDVENDGFVTSVSHLKSPPRDNGGSEVPRG